MSETELTPLEAYCGRCNGDIVNTGPKWKHKGKLAPDLDHEPEPVTVPGRTLVVSTDVG